MLSLLPDQILSGFSFPFPKLSAKKFSKVFGPFAGNGKLIFSFVRHNKKNLDYAIEPGIWLKGFYQIRQKSSLTVPPILFPIYSPALIYYKYPGEKLPHWSQQRV